MEYRPEDDPGVKEIDAGTSDADRRDREARLLQESDNSPKDTDPKDASDDDA